MGSQERSGAIHPAHPYEAMRRLWWWVRGVTADTYHTHCGRCGHNGRVHLLGMSANRLHGFERFNLTC